MILRVRGKEVDEEEPVAQHKMEAKKRKWKISAKKSGEQGTDNDAAQRFRPIPWVLYICL